MMHLLFYLDTDRYAIRAADVIEVIPLVKLKRIPKTPDYVAGMFNYRGVVVPVIDMRRLTASRSINNVMSTRIILVNYMTESEEGHVLGLVVEHATDTVRLNDKEFVDSAVHMGESPCMSDVITDDAGVIQRIDVENILPDHVREILFMKEIKKEVSRVS